MSDHESDFDELDDADDDQFDYADSDNDDDALFGIPPLSLAAATADPSSAAALARATVDSANQLELLASWNGKNITVFLSRTSPIVELKERLAEAFGVGQRNRFQLSMAGFGDLGDGFLLSVLNLRNKSRLILTGEDHIRVVVQEPVSAPSVRPQFTYMGSGGFSPAVQRKSESEELLELLDSTTPQSHFYSTFNDVYGTTHPKIITGSCRAAVARAREQHQILLIYLHFDGPENTYQFCIGALPMLTSLIDEHFLFWIGVPSADQVAALSARIQLNEYPFIAAIATIRGTLTVLEVIKGIVEPDALIVRLLSLNENHSSTLSAARAEQRQQQAARELKREQELEFARSLEEDRRKAQERARQQALEDEQRKAEATRLAAEEAARNEREAELQRSLPPEPAAGLPDVAMLRLKTPDGRNLQRRFNKADKIRHIFAWLRTEQGFGDSAVLELGSTYPRKSFPESSAEALDLTMADAGFHPQATLFLSVS